MCFNRILTDSEFEPVTHKQEKRRPKQKKQRQTEKQRLPALSSSPNAQSLRDVEFSLASLAKNILGIGRPWVSVHSSCPLTRTNPQSLRGVEFFLASRGLKNLGIAWPGVALTPVFPFVLQGASTLCPEHR